MKYSINKYSCKNKCSCKFDAIAGHNYVNKYCTDIDIPESVDEPCVCDESNFMYNKSNIPYDDCCDVAKPYYKKPLPCNDKCVEDDGCSNCDTTCKSCDGIGCDFAHDKIENMIILVKRLFGKDQIEGCPVAIELIIENDDADFDVELDLIEKDCGCECPEITEDSKFTCKCVKVDINSITADSVEAKLNGKEIMLTPEGDCYKGVIDETIVNSDKCDAQEAHLCVRANGWTIDATYIILGKVLTGGKICDFKITIKTVNPLQLDDNTVFYLKDFCATQSEIIICLKEDICFRVDSIIPINDGDDVQIDAVLTMNALAEVTTIKEQEVCIQAVVKG